MMASCSPGSTCRSMPCKAGPLAPARWCTVSCASRKVLMCLLRFLEQACAVGGRFDRLVVLGLGRQEFASLLQGQDFLVFRVGWIQRQEGVGDLFLEGRVHVGAHGPV